MMQDLFRKECKIFFSFNCYYYPVHSYCLLPYLKRDNIKSKVTRRKKKKKSKNTLNSAEGLPFKELCRFVVWKREIETVNVMK